MTEADANVATKHHVHRLCAIILGGFLSGCMAAPYAAYYVAAYAPTALLAGGAAVAAIEYSDVSASVQNDDWSEVKNIQKVAIVASAENSSYALLPYGRAGGPGGSAISDGMVNGVATSLKNGNVDVIDILTLERVLSKKKVQPASVNGQEAYRRTDLVDAAFSAGADGVLVVSAVSDVGYKTGGLFYFGVSARTDVTIKTVNGRLLNNEGDVLMTINVTYKNGQDP